MNFYSEKCVVGKVFTDKGQQFVNTLLDTKGEDEINEQEK